ncbi:MAG: hypothetical protein VCA37_02950 [Roseibacillus sp.]
MRALLPTLGLTSYRRRGMDEQGKLNRTGKPAPLLEQELVRLKDMKMFEEVRKENFGAGQVGNRIPIKYLAPIMVIALLGVAIPFALNVVNWKTPTKDASKHKAQKKLAQPVREPSVIIDESAVSNLTSREVAQAFLDATSEEERLALVRNPNEVRSGMVTFPDEVKSYPIEHTFVKPMGVATAGGIMRFQRFSVSMPDGRPRFLCVAETPRGPLVDYEAFARHGTVNWEKLLAGEAGEMVRLLVKPSFYFNHGFTDEKKWVAFELSNPDWPASLTGYAPVGSPTAGLLGAITSKVPKQRVTLKIRPEGDSHQHKQVVIERVLANGWVQTEGDLEARWQLREGRKSSPLR